MHMCAWAWALQNSGGFIPVRWRLFKWHVDVYINEAVFIQTRRKRWDIVLICARATPAGSWKLSRGLPILISLPAGMYLYVKMPGRKICCSALGVNGFLNRLKTYMHSHSLALPLREDRKGCVCAVDSF